MNKKGGFARSFFSFVTTATFIIVGYFFIFGNPFEPGHDGPLLTIAQMSQRLTNSDTLTELFIPKNESENPGKFIIVNGTSQTLINIPPNNPSGTNVTTYITQDTHADILEDIQDDGTLNLDLLDI